MRNLLDRIFVNHKAAVIVPLVTGAAMYLLFVLFGQGANKMELLLMVPVGSAIWYLVMYFGLLLLAKLVPCPGWLLDILELAALAVYGVGAFGLGLRFLLNMAVNFAPNLCTCIISWSAIALVHGKRK